MFLTTVARLRRIQLYRSISNINFDQSSTTKGVYHLTLAYKEKNNSFSVDFLEEFNEVIQECHENHFIRCLIIKSSLPKVFCAGADLKERLAMADEEVGPFVSRLRDMTAKVASLSFPTIAAIEGAAFGGGLELALSCDIRVGGANAMVGLTETSLAVIPGAGGTQRLSRIIGVSKAKELIFTASKLSAQEAFEFGILNHVVEVGQALEKAENIASKIVQNGPVAIRMAKLAVDKGLDVDLSGGLDIEKLCYEQIVRTKDRREGLNAFIEKRKPVYEGN